MTDRFQSIRDALAMGPTPGPWELKDGRTDTIENAQGYPVCTVHHHPYELYGHGARAAYIAACDPDTIRDLLAERDALAAEIERLREAMELARAVLAQSITAGHNVPGPIPEDIEKAFWALDAALTASEAKQ